jgi:phage-related tail protein
LVAESTNRTLTATPPATFTLRIRAEQTTWVSITADGKAIGHETLIAPAHTSVRATHDVAVKVGNAAGVSFLLNGKEFPAQGNVGEVKTYIFDATGLNAGAQTTSPTTNR